MNNIKEGAQNIEYLDEESLKYLNILDEREHQDMAQGWFY